jgi:hypothetical protein
MSARIPAPVIDTRSAAALVKLLQGLIPHYTPEWAAKDADDPGMALFRAFAFLTEGVIDRLNLAPDRNFYAFLDMLGIRLLPPTPSRGPLRFVPANGADPTIFVPAGAETSASSGSQPIPFETDEDLLVVAANLTALVAADPIADSIYLPPPGFLVLDVVANELPPHTLQAFAAPGDANFQLDFADQLKGGDVLRIQQPVTSAGFASCDDSSDSTTLTSDYLVVKEVKGSVVTLDDPLPRDYAEGTAVKEVTQFSLLEGKNVQQHVLYLGHNDYFSVKSEASFELRLTQAAGSAAGLSPLPVLWEFWGSVASAPSAPDAWQPFQVQADGSSGFTDTGTVQLFKPEGEIKQTPINGVKSRWIRARLDAPLPATPPRAIPRIDSIQLRVSSNGAIAADQGFNNDTPLPVNLAFPPGNQPFPPFGFEPRAFDRFYVASSEAFSKPGALVTLKIDLDISELLDAPAAVFVGGKAHVFAHGAGGVLDEFTINPTLSSQPPPFAHPQPTGTQVKTDSIPAAVLEPVSGTIGVFVVGDDGNIWLRWLPSNTDQWQWFNVQSPPGSKLQFNPAAVLINGVWQAFVVKDGKVYGRTIDPRNAAPLSQWSALVTQSFTAGSTPFAVALTIPAGAASVALMRLVVFDVAADVTSSGHTWAWDGSTWTNITPGGASAASYLAAKDSSPFAQVFRAATGPFQVRVFLRNQGNQLAVFDTSGLAEIWGAPDNRTLLSSPVVFATNLADLSTVRVFLTGKDNILAEAMHNPVAPPPALWTVHSGPLGSNLVDAPFLLPYSAGSAGLTFSLFSASDQNTLLEFRSAPSTSILRAGPKQLIPLHSALDPADVYVQILDGPDKDKTFHILDGTDYARLDGTLSEPIKKDTPYQLFSQLESGTVSAPASDQATLIAHTAADAGNYLLVLTADPPLRKIQSKSGDTVKLEDPWTTAPEAGDPYVLLQLDVRNQKAKDGAAVTVLLDSAASSTKFLQLTPPGGGQPAPFKITKFDSDDRAATLDSPPPDGTAAGTSYQITDTAFPQPWFSYSDIDQSDLRPKLSWEYWNGSGWVNLPDLNDQTGNLLVTGTITFTLPSDIAQTEVAGQKNYWIRSRIVGGDYGRETFSFTLNPAGQASTITVNKSAIRPPSIQSLTISYSMTQDTDPQVCLTFNNLDWLDQTAANTVTGKYFQPFLPLPVLQQCLFFGLDQSFEGGPVQIYFAAEELAVDESDPPKLAWEYAAANDWKTLPSQDATNAFTRPDRLGLVMQPDWQERDQFSQSLYWVRARLVSGSWPSSPVLSGIFPNTCWTIQARTIINEILGSSTGTANLTLHFQQVPVLDGEEVRVRETLTDSDRKALIDAGSADAVKVVFDNQGKPLETWVRWNEVLEFYDSSPTDRVYRMDRAVGEIQFGDGKNGRMPEIGGDNIVAFSYRAGGGSQGNVAANQITTLVTAVAGIQSVLNPDAFDGGSEQATPEQMLIFGPAQISNRERAVTPDDFESLAVEASRKVRKARCVPDVNSSGQSEAGWVSVYIVPESTDAQPLPTLELRRTVEQYLLARAPVTLSGLDRIFIGPPSYVVVSVDATVFATSLDAVGTAEQAVRDTLKTFLHPLTGGPDGQGWDFGRALAASDLYSVLEDIATVDHIETITLTFDGQTSTERVAVGPNQLLAGGEHTIRMNFGGEN